jgi:stearoyl-CoA desaturase (delta-9 desaturase)
MGGPAKIIKSPHRFEPWTLSLSENLKCFRAWWKSLAQESSAGRAAIGWVILSPIITLLGLFVTPWHLNTIIFTVVAFLITAQCVMLSYHRMLSHKAFSVSSTTKTVLLMIGASAMEGPALGWVRNHRAHHRFLDTEKDPYDAKKGFWWSHMGWAIHPYDPEQFADIDVSDLTSDPIVMFQNDYYQPIALSIGFIFPTLFCGLLWGDYAGGFWLGAMLRMQLCLQSAFFTNSAAHYHGEHTYFDQSTPVDSPFVQFLTSGEGFHNFHHAFPYDYRGTSNPWAIDPIKWLTYLLSLLGITFDLKQYPDNMIDHARLETTKNRIERQMAQIAPGKPLDQLAPMTTADVRRRAEEGASLIIIDGLVHDVTEFLPEHPGGEAILKTYFGKDATKAFYGTITQHTQGARKILASLTMAKIVEKKTD